MARHQQVPLLAPALSAPERQNLWGWCSYKVLFGLWVQHFRIQSAFFLHCTLKQPPLMPNPFPRWFQVTDFDSNIGRHQPFFIISSLKCSLELFSSHQYIGQHIRIEPPDLDPTTLLQLILLIQCSFQITLLVQFISSMSSNQHSFDPSQLPQSRRSAQLLPQCCLPLFIPCLYLLNLLPSILSLLLGSLATWSPV